MTILNDLKKAAKQPGTIELIRASDVEIEEIQWLWPHHLARGALELETGIPDIGKSQVQSSLAACVTACLTWPDGTPGMLKPANVIMLTAEDTITQGMVPRLIAAGADLDRVHILKGSGKTTRTGSFYLLKTLRHWKRR